MNSEDTPIAKHPAAWLRPLPEGYRIPVWRWVLLPATAIMLKRTGGVWVSGELNLMHDRLVFTESKLVKSRRNPPGKWDLALDLISNVTIKPGIASETIELQLPGEILKLMSVRSAEFVEHLNRAIANHLQHTPHQQEE